MSKKIGWEANGMLPWEDVWDYGAEIEFYYQGRHFFMDLCDNPPDIYEYLDENDYSKRKIVAVFERNNEEAFYNATVFGKPIREFFEEAYDIILW